MAKNTQVSEAAANAQADALSGMLNGGYLRLYTGAQPANADAMVGDQVLLAELRFAALAAPYAVAGVIKFNAIEAGHAAASGKAAWFRALGIDGLAVIDGTVGTVDAGAENLQLNSNVIGRGAGVTITGFTHTVQTATSGT